MIFKQCKQYMLVVTLLLVSLILISGAEAKNTKPKEEKAAMVNGKVITQSYLDQHVNMILKQFPGKDGQIENDRIARIRFKVLDDLINREVLFQESEKAGVKIEPAIVDEQFAKMKKQHPDGQAFEKYMSSLNLTEASIKSQIGKGLAIKKFVDTTIVDKIDVSEKELKDYYRKNKERFTRPETVRASHILIKVDKDAIEFEKKEAKKEIEKIRARALKKEDFADLAKKFSQGPSAENGGALGFFQRGQMVKPFEEAAFALKPGEISDVVKTEFGFHIIKVLDKKPSETTSLKEVRVRLKEFLKQGKVRKEIMAYVEKLRKKAKIEKFIAEAPAK
ncbi:MAG: peptidylprolyl isomerase [Deltaproteobacteria bacterium]|nr:peptidylprolyl isomerase [Deltaproteobacteria bacterium]